MKQIIFIITVLILPFSCKAQSVYPLEGPFGNDSDSRPIFIKDINNIRNSFYGVWQGTSGISELTMYFYKIDDVPHGLFGPIGEQFADKLFGYYTYKENGIELINSLTEAQTVTAQHIMGIAPFYGITNDGITLEPIFFIDYGIQIHNVDSSYRSKGGIASFNITNIGSTTLQANFELKNRQGAGQIIITNGATIEPYNYNFSIPTNLVLTKISNTPPPLN